MRCNFAYLPNSKQLCSFKHAPFHVCLLNYLPSSPLFTSALSVGITPVYITPVIISDQKEHQHGNHAYLWDENTATSILAYDGSVGCCRLRLKCDGTEQKTDFVFRRNGRVRLNRQGRQFSRLLAAEVWASAVVMLDAPRSAVVWRVLATHSIRQFPLHFPSRASPCAIRFQLDSTTTSKSTELSLRIFGWILSSLPPASNGYLAFSLQVLTDEILKLSMRSIAPGRLKRSCPSQLHNFMCCKRWNICEFRNLVLYLAKPMHSVLNSIWTYAWNSSLSFITIY